MEDALKMACELGRDAGDAAGSWTANGNTSMEHAEKVLRMMQDGDPMAWDYLPNMPNLSGEMAGNPTPQSLAEDCGMEDASPDEIHMLCEAWENRVSEIFGLACERELLAIVS